MSGMESQIKSKARFILETFRLLREHQPWKLVLIMLLTLLQGVTSGFSIVLLIPLLQLLNIGTGGEPDGIALAIRNFAEGAGIEITIGSILVVYMVLLTFSALIQYWKAILDARYQQTFIYTLRRRLFRKIIMADWQLLNSRSKTNHLQVLTREVPNLAAYYFFYLRLLTTVIMTGAYTLYALLISARFTLIIIGVGAITFLAMRRFLSRSFRLGKGYVDSYNRLLKYIDDFWQTVKIAKVHSSEDYYYNRFDEANTSLLNMEYRMQRNWSLPQLIQRIVGLVVLVGIVWFGYRSGNTPMASFVILILLFSRIFPQLIAINTDINMIVSNVPSVKLVMQLDADLPDVGVSAERRERSGERGERRAKRTGQGEEHRERSAQCMHETAPITSQGRRFRRLGSPFRLALLAGLLALACAACQPVQAVSEVAPAGEVESDVVVVAETRTDDSSEGAAQVAGADAAVSEPAAPPAAIQDEALVQRGLEVYRAQYCGICHALSAAGTTGRFGPEHDGMGTIAEERIAAANYSGQATNAEEYVYESLVKPEIFTVDGYASSSHRMPPYTHLSEEDLLALTAFLLAQ